MSIQESIEHKLAQAFTLSHLEVVNESHMHSVPANSETHFKLVVVSDDFDGTRSVARHQQVYKILAEELQGEVHALAIHTYTPVEWQGQVPDSPNCMGGSAGE
ncbi:MAG: BolA protein [Pseudohongiellaceae bacterium]|jgi:BolA protein